MFTCLNKQFDLQWFLLSSQDKVVSKFQVVSESYRPDESKNLGVPKVLKDLYTCCWAQKPEARPQMSYVAKVLSQFKLSSSEGKEKKRPPSISRLR